MAIPTLKTGWLLRQSNVLKRWKRNWFVLYGDGNLAYYEDDNLHQREGNFNISMTCKSVKTALECGVNPPEERNYGCLLKLMSKQDSDLMICAFNSDEALAWKLMIEPFIRLAHPPNAVRSYTAYPNATTTTIRYPAYPNQNVRPNYPVQQNVPVYYYPNYGPVQVLRTTNGQPYYVHPHTQVVTIIQENDPYYYRNGDMMWGVAAGAMLGAALWSPFFFF